MSEDGHIATEEPPKLTAPVASTVAALAMFAGCIFMAFGEPSPTAGIITVVSTVVVIAVAVLQWALYGRAYIDYRTARQRSQ
jgi:hypothetical protein